MKKTPEYLTYFLQDCLSGEPSFTIKHMFGGYAIYKSGKVFSLFIGDIIYFKVGDNNRKYFEKYNSKPFSYNKKGGDVGVLSYWELPEEVMENREELDIWIERSLDVPSTTKVKKKKTKESLIIDKKILESLLKIPDGMVTTYKILADRFGVHSRRIASVMKYNGLPEKYPCYKVISHSRKVGGYSAMDGVDTKISMLKNDGIKIVDGKVGKEYIYNF